MKTIKWAGLTYELQQLGEASWSLRCLDMPADMDASDIDWPPDRVVSDMAGRMLRFFDGGDNLTEAIYFPAVRS